MTDIIARFRYRNHRGDVADRTVTVDGIEFLSNPGFGYQPGWFITGTCHDQKARRSFAISHIILDEQASLPSRALCRINMKAST